MGEKQGDVINIKCMGFPKSPRQTFRKLFISTHNLDPTFLRLKLIGKDPIDWVNRFKILCKNVTEVKIIQFSVGFQYSNEIPG